jgi:hypothetical protein
MQEAMLLEMIGDLSTFRVYSRESVATARWKDLPMLSQHHDFFQAVRSLLGHAVSLEALYDQPAHFTTSECDQTMFNRVASRNKLYYPSDLHLPKQLSFARDISYISRDVSDAGTAHDDMSDRHRRIEKYTRLMFEDIRLLRHVEQLQRFSWQQQLRSVSIPTTVPSAFAPKFIRRNSKAPLYSLSEVLESRSSVPTPSPDGQPFQDCASLPPTEEIEKILPPAASGSLKILIEELLNSRQPSLQLYGNGLNKSHHALLGRNNSRYSGEAVPSHELLLDYHEQCSHRRDKLFSELSAALAPSQGVEEFICIAGLWPRITPRSLLHQLTQGRIGTLPDQWKFVITRYAVSFLKYQQSLRMLELSSRQKTEELLREVEAISHDVLAGSTPDWLLIQVHHFLY